MVSNSNKFLMYDWLSSITSCKTRNVIVSSNINVADQLPVEDTLELMQYYREPKEHEYEAMRFMVLYFWTYCLGRKVASPRI